MRPGRPADMPRLIELWRGEVAAGRLDAFPGEPRMRTFLEKFDWDGRSRVTENGNRIIGAALVSARLSPDGLIATINLAGDPLATNDLVRWALGLSRAGGARIAQVFAARGQQALNDIGFHVARPWLRMDRTLEGTLPRVGSTAGYRVIDGTKANPDAWSVTFNHAFADHWRFTPRSEEEIVGGKPPHLCLMADSAEDGEPVAIALGELEEYEHDPRPQPVGLISSVGTAPKHRRRGLARWLVSELLSRLQEAGARTASLYVDGFSETRAFDVYRKLGFEVAYEAEVWEASLP